MADDEQQPDGRNPEAQRAEAQNADTQSTDTQNGPAESTAAPRADTQHAAAPMADIPHTNAHPADTRPRPRYGELAPPGWTWSPPEDSDRLDTARRGPAASEPTDAASEERPAEQPRAASPQHGQHPQSGASLPSPASPQLRADAPRWNITATIVLLVLGFFGMTYSIGTLQALPAAMQLMHSNQGLAAFTPADSVGALITAGSIAMGGIWAVSAGLSVWLLVQKRLAFYIPLIAGVVALIALFVIVGIVLATDPVLVDSFSGIPTTPSPSTSPSP